MDISTTLHKKQTKIDKKWFLTIAIIFISLMSLWGFSSITTQQRISLSELRIAEIKQGEFNVDVNGYGRLKAKYQRILTSQSQAIVQEIKLYPGAKVTKNSVILTLSDPLLEQEVVNAKLALARQKAEFSEQIISHKSQLLERDSQIALLKSELENTQLRAQAEQKLIDKGIVSMLDYKRTQLNVRQLTQRLEIEHARQAQLKEMQVQRIKISKDLITQVELNFKTIQHRFGRLQVRAGLDGVLQTLPVEIGQSVLPGTQLATVGSDQQLIAQLKVQHNQADQISIGMSAEINTFGQTVMAQVIRIDPIVTDGRVVIELDLTGPLPSNARPDLTVEGLIKIKHIKDTLFVEKPFDVASFNNRDIYRLSKDKQTARLLPVEFGTLSGDQIEVINGVSRGDKIIISDTTQWNKTSKVLLND